MNHLNTSKSAQDVAKKCLDVNRPINEDTWHFTGLNTQLFTWSIYKLTTTIYQKLILFNYYKSSPSFNKQEHILKSKLTMARFPSNQVEFANCYTQ